MKTRLEQLEIEMAFEKGAKIEFKLVDFKYDKFIDNKIPTWNWDNYDFRIKEEQKRIPFDGSDAFNLLLNNKPVSKMNFQKKLIRIIFIRHNNLFFVVSRKHYF